MAWNQGAMCGVRSGLIALGLLVPMLTGCTSTSVWERALSRGPDAALVAPDTAPLPVTVRRVPWERVERTQRDVEAMMASSDTHPDEWSAQRQEELRALLLRGLQVSQPASQVQILGNSQFRTTDALGQADAELVRIAQDLGATMVVYSTRVLGKADKIVQEPVSTTTYGTDWYRGRDENGRRRSGSYTENSTTWVPIRVSADEVGAIAYFLRVP